MGGTTDYIDKSYHSVKMQFRIWDCVGKSWMETENDKISAIAELIRGNGRYTICMGLGQIDVKGQDIYVDQIIKYAHNWDFEGGYEPHNRVFKNDTKKHKVFHLGIVKFHAETATYVIWPYRITCRVDSLLIEVVGDIHVNPELAATIEYPYDDDGNHIKK